VNIIKSHKKIATFLKRKCLLNISIVLVEISIIALLTFIFLSFLEAIGYFSPAVKSVMIYSLFGLITILLLLFITKPIRKIMKVRTIAEINSGAEEIGNNFPSIKDKLLNVLQLIQDDNTKSSKDLVIAAFEKVYIKVAGLNFLSILKYSKLKNRILILFSIAVTFILVFLSFDFLANGALRLIKFNTTFNEPREFEIIVLKGNKKIEKGMNVSLEVKAIGKIPEEINILTQSTIESEFKENRVRADSNNIFRIQKRNIKNSMLYFAKKSEVTTDTFNIEVISLPIINNMRYEIISPQYSKIPKIIQENNGNITALRGSTIKFNITSNKALSKANRIYSNNLTDSIYVENNKISGEFNLMADDIYHFEIFDMEKNTNKDPIRYSIKTITDQFPNIEIVRPEEISMLPSNDIVSVNYSIKDDFGFSKVLLKYSTSQLAMSNEFNTIQLKIDPSEIEQLLYFNWDVNTLSLRENEVVHYYLQVFDNDLVSGPKSTKSVLMKLRVPTLDELFAQSEITQESAITELTKNLESAEELQKELLQISDEMKQNEKKINWNEKERIEESIKKFEEMKSNIDEIQDNLDDMRKQMTENNLLSEETMQKYNELQDLMDELDSEELKKALANMQKSLEQLNRDKVQKALDELSFNEEMFQKSIERTLNLLKKIQIEQKIDEVIKRTEKISNDLEKLSTETKANRNNKDEFNKQKNSKEQKNISDQLNSLETEMQNLQEKMSEVNDMPTEKMQDLNEQFTEQKNQELSQKALEQLQQQNPFNALKNQQQLSQNMSSMMEQMKDMQQQMQQQSQQMVMQNMLRAIDNIIGLSKEQENLINETKKIMSQPRELTKLAQPEMDIKHNLDNVLKQLNELSQKSFAITPEMGQALGQARQNMRESVAGMQNRNSQKSVFSQGEAMKNLNEAAGLLQSSLQAMMQGGGPGGGMMSLMQQLQQMAQQQMGLNKLTQMMKSGQLSLQQQAQLQRLAQEQAAIQKSINELNREAREAGSSKKLTANLEKILKDMKEVISGFNTKKVDDNLIKTQEKILSKLLDVQRSINERDFEENRESFAGKEFNLESPGELILDNEQTISILREELLKSIQDGYSKDYENLIRRYFESLNQNSNNN